MSDSQPVRALILEQETGESGVRASVQEVSEKRCRRATSWLPSTIRISMTRTGWSWAGLAGWCAPIRTFQALIFRRRGRGLRIAVYKPGDSVILTGWRVGEVWWGGYASKARVKAEWLVPLPEGMTLHQAMAIGTAGFTAMGADGAGRARPAAGEQGRGAGHRCRRWRRQHRRRTARQSRLSRRRSHRPRRHARLLARAGRRRSSIATNWKRHRKGRWRRSAGRAPSTTSAALASAPCLPVSATGPAAPRWATPAASPSTPRSSRFCCAASTCSASIPPPVRASVAWLPGRGWRGNRPWTSSPPSPTRCRWVKAPAMGRQILKGVVRGRTVIDAKFLRYCYHCEHILL